MSEALDVAMASSDIQTVRTYFMMGRRDALTMVCLKTPVGLFGVEESPWIAGYTFGRKCLAEDAREAGLH